MPHALDGNDDPMTPREQEHPFQLLVESLRDCALFMLDPNGRVTTWNAGAELFKGYSAGEIIGRHFSVFYSPEDNAAKKPERQLAAAALEGYYEDEGWRVRKDGSRFWARVVISPVRDRGGQLLGFGKLTRDLTEYRKSGEDQAFIFDLGESLRLLEDPDVLVSQLVKRTAEYLKVSRCVFSDIDASGEQVTYRSDYFRPGLGSLRGTYPVSSFGPVVTDLRAGRAVIYTDAQVDPRTADQFEASYCPIGVVASIAMPLLEDGRFRAALFVSSETPRQWTTREVSLVQAVAEKGWLWFKHLTERQRIENERAEAARDHHFLFDLGESLRLNDDSESILLNATRRLAEHLKLSRCIFNDVDLSHDELVNRYGFHGDLAPIPGPYPVSSFSPDSVSDFKAGRAVINHDAQSDPRTAPLFEARYRSLGICAAVSIPLFDGRQWRALFMAIQGAPRTWTPREVSLIQTVAEKSWLWVKHISDRARADQERSAVARDQKFLLDLSEAARSIENQDDLVSHTVTETGRHLETSRCLVSEVDLEKEETRIRNDYHSTLPSLAGTLSLLTASSDTLDALKEARTVAYEDVRVDPRTRGLYERRYKAINIVAFVAVPLFREARLKSTLTVASDVPRKWQPREIALVEMVADKLWLWLKHVEMLQALRERENQLRLLATDLERRVEERTAELRVRAHVLSAMSEGVALADSNRKILWVNTAEEKMFGYGAGELIGQSPEVLLAKEEAHRAPEIQARLAEEGVWEGEVIRLRKDGSRFISWTHLSSITVDGERCLVAVMQDITKRKQAEDDLARSTAELAAASRQLERVAFLDPLTDVLNRRGLEHILRAELARADRQGSSIFGVLIDCDDFKSINERFGHAGGDRVLAGIAKRVESSIRREDHCARIGGDEFLVVLPNTGARDAAALAERVRQAIAGSKFGEVSATVSLGVFAIPNMAQAVTDILVHAQRSLVDGKRSGKNVVCVEPAERITSDKWLDALVGADGEHLRVCQQSISRLSDQVVVAYEMSIRGPRGPFERPEDLFAQGRAQRRITQLDLVCLRRCAEATRSLGGARYHLNVEGTTLLDRPEELLEICAREPLIKWSIELNLKRLGDPARFGGITERLRDAGIEVTLAHFDLSPRALEALILLRPQMVKLTRELVVAAIADPGQAAKLSRLVRVANSLSAEVIAPGIESAEALRVIGQVGTQYGQGGFWKDMPSASA